MLLVGNIQPSILAWWVLRAWAGVVFQVIWRAVGWQHVQPSTLAWCVLRAWAGVVFQVIWGAVGWQHTAWYPCMVCAQSVGWCCVSGDLACCRLATYSLVPLHRGCSERGLVLCFRCHLACCWLATYSLVPLHGGCSERGLVLCFRSFGVL